MRSKPGMAFLFRPSRGPESIGVLAKAGAMNVRLN